MKAPVKPKSAAATPKRKARPKPAAVAPAKSSTAQAAGKTAGQAPAPEKPARSVVSANGLSLTFHTNDGPVHALSDVNLEIGEGEFVSFIGPSGCGKTTFLRVIADLEQPTGGTIAVNGMSPAEARQRRAYGYVFQAAALYPWRTIERNVALPLEIMGYSKSEQAQRVARMLELVNLTGFEKKYPWQLSGGMQQRASIARALSFDADLLLMDEPFGALDEIVRDHLNEQLLQLWQTTNKTICFVTHSIPEAVYLSTKIVVMSPRPGRVTDVIESTLPRERPLDIRETPQFLKIAHRVREGLRAGHSYEE
jgi:NitT/TauT family transport system ATP-binding protein